MNLTDIYLAYIYEDSVKRKNLLNDFIKYYHTHKTLFKKKIYIYINFI